MDKYIENVQNKLENPKLHDNIDRIILKWITINDIKYCIHRIFTANIHYIHYEYYKLILLYCITSTYNLINNKNNEISMYSKEYLKIRYEPDLMDYFSMNVTIHRNYKKIHALYSVMIDLLNNIEEFSPNSNDCYFFYNNNCPSKIVLLLLSLEEVEDGLGAHYINRIHNRYIKNHIIFYAKKYNNYLYNKIIKNDYILNVISK